MIIIGAYIKFNSSGHAYIRDVYGPKSESIYAPCLEWYWSIDTIPFYAAVNDVCDFRFNTMLL